MSLEADDLAAETIHLEHRRERGRRLRLSILSAILTKPLALVIPFVVVRLFLNYLGTDRYGLYQAVGALAAWFGLTNAGLGLGLVNRLSDCYVSNDRDLARRYVSSLTFVLLGIGVVCTAILAIVVPFVRWQDIFRCDDPRGLHEMAPAVFVAGLATLMGVWVSLPNVIYTAYQELHRANLWDAASRIVALCACFLVIYSPWGVVGVIVAVSLVPALMRLLNMVWMFLIEKSWLRPRLRDVDLKLIKRVLAEGVCFFVLQMAVMALFQTDKLIISATLSTADVTPYAVVGQVFISGYGLLMLFMGPLWPAHAESLRRGDIAWVKRMTRYSLLLGCGSMAAVGVVLLTFGHPIIRLIAHQDIQFSNGLVLGLMCMFILRAWVDCRSIVLNSAGVLRIQMIFFGCHATANVLLAIFLARRIGAEGVAWATVITSLITSSWGYPWMIRRFIWSRAEAKPATIGGATSVPV